VYTDTFLGPEVKSYLGRRGFHVEVVNVTQAVQTEGFNSLKARIEDGSLLLWRCAQLLEDLRRISLRSNERVVLPRYSGGHCDAAAALALAVRHFTPSLRSPAVALPVQYPVAVRASYGFSPLDTW
jgi:phage FluMu gp28-like protein